MSPSKQRNSIQAQIGMCALALALAAILPLTAQAQYPSKPIRLIVPTAAGSSTEAPARMIAEAVKDALGQPLLIENRPGAGGLVGAMAAARSTADGYALLFAASSIAIPQAIEKVDFDLRKDLVPIAVVAQGVLGLHVHSSMPVSSVAELIAYAKERPGKLNYGSAGPGSTNHLITELFRSLVGIDIVHVPYNNAQGLVTAAITNEVGILMHDVAFLKPQVTAGKLRLLGVATLKPTPLAPQAATIGGRDGVPAFEGTFFFAFYAPAGTPAEVIQKIYQPIASWWQNGANQKKLLELGYEPRLENSEGAAKLVASYVERFTKVAAAAGLRKQ